MRRVPHLALLRAPALLLLWQVAPMKVDFNDAGRIRFALGFTRGIYEDQRMDCQGRVTSRSRVKNAAVGAQAEAWISPKFRIAAAGGSWSGSSDSSWARIDEGGYGTALLAWEGGKVGLGLGVVSHPYYQGGQTNVALYGRFGRLEKVHLRFDGMESAAPGVPAPVRISLAKGYGPRMGQPRWAVGLATLHPASENAVGFFGELGIPAGRVEPLITGWATPGAANYGVGFGLRAALGPTRR